MTRLALGAAFTLMVASTSAVHADIDIPDNVQSAADMAGVSPMDLLGAVVTTGMEPRTYLCQADGLLCPQPVSGVWGALAQCESGGNPKTNTGNGYYGMFQEDKSFWSNYGNHAYLRPDLAPVSEQLAAAQRGRAVQGWRAWPACSRHLGLI